LLKQRTVLPAWPPAEPKNWGQLLLQYLGIPLTRQMTQEEFVKAFASSPVVSSEDLMHIFHTVNVNAESVLPMESILKNLTERTSTYSSTQLFTMRQLLTGSVSTEKTDLDAGTGEKFDAADGSSQQQNAQAPHITPALCIEEVEPSIKDTAKENDGSNVMNKCSL